VRSAGEKRRTNGSNMGEPIRTRKNFGWKSRARCTTGSCGAIQKNGRRKSAHFNSAGKKSALSIMKRSYLLDGSKKKAHRRQSVRYRSWWKQGRGGSKATSKWQ